MTNLVPTNLIPPGDSGPFLHAFAAEFAAEGTLKPRLGDELLLHLPVDRRPSGASTSLAEAGYKMSGARMAGLARIADALGSNRDAFFLTAFAAMLARLSGQEVVTLRSFAGRPAVLTLDFDAETSFCSRLDAAAGGFVPDQPCAIEFVSCADWSSGADLPHHSVRLTLQNSEDESVISLASSTGLWDESTLRLWLRYFDHLLTAAAAAPQIPWKTLPLLDPGEARQYYLAFNNTAEAELPHACVHELVMRQARSTPDAVAIASVSGPITYRQLDQRSDAVARALRSLGAGPDRPVAVCIERTAELPLALLGVLKAGSCYVPLDPEDSPQRLAGILAECRPAAMIVDFTSPVLPSTDSTPRVYLDRISQLSTEAVPDAPALQVTLNVKPSDLAYIIYTSGTTGKPKGVPIAHGSLTNLLRFIMREPGIASSDRMLAVAPISFDIGTMDIFVPLMAGATVVVADRLAAADPLRLAALLEKFEISVLQATPATWRLLASSGWQGKYDLKMISGGEALPRDLANQLLHLGAELWNCYGPTETTIWSSVLRVQQGSGTVPVGPPMANTTFYILDETGRLLPPGVPGELCIGGRGVSPGYIDRPEIDRQRFLPDPFAGGRMFRSGDLFRLVNGNEFEFLGRLDQQVKLRGYRIELEEIESVLRTCPGVANAVAVLRKTEPGEPYLAAYITVSQQPPEPRVLRDHLAQRLPAYMVPSRYAILQALPLNANGKIDRKALLTLAAAAELSGYHQTEGVKPQTPLQQKLLTIFREVLNTTEFGVSDNFFDYGGYSLMTVELFTRIHRALNLDLPISLLFDAPTVQALATVIEHGQLLPRIVPIRPQGRSAPLFVIHSYLLYALLPRIVEQDRPVYGVRELPGEVDPQSVEELAARYVQEILKVHHSGPLLLSGWCGAAYLTIEVARQFRSIGHNVGLVALFDAERPGYRPTVRGSWFARRIGSLKFHSQRLGRLNAREKFEYFGNALRHWGQVFLQSFFITHRSRLLTLQRILGFSLPDVVFNNTWSRGAAIQNYAPANYPGKLVLFRATDVPQISELDATLGWKELADGGVDVVFVPGDHESMFRDPNAEVFGTRLREAMQLPESG